MMLCRRSSLSFSLHLIPLLHLILILSPGLMLSRSERLQGRTQGAWQCGEFAETTHELSRATRTMLALPTAPLVAPSSASSSPSPILAVVGGQRQMCFRLVALGYSAAPQPANNVHSRSQCRAKPKIKIFLVSQRRLNILPLFSASFPPPPLLFASSQPRPLVAINRHRSTL